MPVPGLMLNSDDYLGGLKLMVLTTLCFNVTSRVVGVVKPCVGGSTGARL